MTIEEIMLGKGDYYPGLVPLVYAFLGHIGCDADTMDTVDQVIQQFNSSTQDSDFGAASIVAAVRFDIHSAFVVPSQHRGGC